ncbi:hypothetical protein PIB30_028296 [Stylosanthes scabra]|uniref:Uncharacterized protein n=1 Tax=Stylosanthes scabra TaxID=79078 RepID=A0ABU6XB42_9FABA|nr:hypothetical protein [Stylosanthes scabra]
MHHHRILCFAAVIPAVVKIAAKPFNNTVIGGDWVTVAKSFRGGKMSPRNKRKPPLSSAFLVVYEEDAHALSALPPSRSPLTLTSVVPSITHYYSFSLRHSAAPAPLPVISAPPPSTTLLGLATLSRRPAVPALLHHLSVPATPSVTHRRPSKGVRPSAVAPSLCRKFEARGCPLWHKEWDERRGLEAKELLD